MISTSQFLLLALTCVAGIHLAIQENCEPGTVINLQLNGNGTLSWESPPDEQCEIAFYLVYVSSSNGTVEFSYVVPDTQVDVGHLVPCDSYVFRVHQITTENITGSGWAVYSITPPPTEADLNLAYLNLTQEGRRVRLQYALQPEWVRCARHYQILFYDEDTDTPIDYYTGMTDLLINIIPCGHYKFGVRAVFTLEEEGPMILVEHVGDGFVTEPPVLDSIELHSRSVTLKWQLESYARNRCHISDIIIDGSPLFNVTQEILDQSNRPPISVTVSGLNPDNLYYLRATVENSAGTSNQTFLAVQTLAA